jgi:hypothetical protein
MWILTDYPVAMIVLFGSTLRYYRANNLVPPDSRSPIRPKRIDTTSAVGC